VYRFTLGNKFGTLLKLTTRRCFRVRRGPKGGRGATKIQESLNSTLICQNWPNRAKHDQNQEPRPAGSAGFRRRIVAEIFSQCSSLNLIFYPTENPTDAQRLASGIRRHLLSSTPPASILHSLTFSPRRLR
jgi:hypothetical protein